MYTTKCCVSEADCGTISHVCVVELTHEGDWSGALGLSVTHNLEEGAVQQFLVMAQVASLHT